MSATAAIIFTKSSPQPVASRISMGAAKILSEAELIAGCVVNDRRCQQQVFEHYYGRMFSVCMRYASSRDEAKDILQEGFLKFFEKISTYSHEGSFEGWMRRIITNLAIDFFRKSRKNMELFENNIDGTELENRGDDSSGDDNELIARFRPEDVLQAVQQLTPAYRAAFNLYVVDGFTHKEIGEKLGISEGTSKSNLAKAKMKLKEYLTRLQTVNR
jgi:RNA polymerase sigma-70 factor (ECF subfamily)